MKQTKRHSILILATMLLLLVASDILYAQKAAGISTDKATRITAPMTLTVQSGSNYIRFEGDGLPAVVTYTPSAPFGTIPTTLVMGDTIEAEMVYADCGMVWRWSIEEAENGVIVEMKAHESATIFAEPHTCEVTSSDTTAEACDSLFWKEAWRYASGDYTYHATNAAGCDSIVTLHLTINKSTVSEETIDECDSLFWSGEWYKESGDYEYHTTNVAGCDSTAILHLTIHHSKSVVLPDTAVCETDDGTEYIWSDPVKGDSIIKDAGTYTRSFKTAYGCDSIVTQTVQFLYVTFGRGTVTAYDSYTTSWGSTYKKSTPAATDYLTNAAGCDSVVTLDLYIRHLQENDTFPQTVCASELPFVWYGKSYTESGLYTTDTILGIEVDGVYMDTVHTVNLTVLPVSVGDTTATACEEFTWYGITYTESAEPTHTLPNMYDCDSVVTLHLTINHANTGDTMVTACESFEWYGTTYTESAEPTHTFTNSHGCDSVVTLHLTISHTSSGEESRTEYDGYTWHDVAYTESGDYTYETTNVAGCDSTATLHLTIRHLINDTVNQKICSNQTPFAWRGVEYSASGIYSTDTLLGQMVNNVYMDTVHTLVLTVNNAYEDLEESVTSYDAEYLWNGQVYTQSGDYVFEGKTTAGCDSIVTLHLTLLELPDYDYDTVYFCQGFNTVHEELISETMIRRYRMYVYESPAEWDFKEGLLLGQQDHRVELDLRHVEQSLEAHYVGELEPVKLIQWSFIKKGETTIETLQSTAEPLWKDLGRLTIEVRFTCGHVFSETIAVGSTEDMEDIDAEQTSVRKVLKNGQIYLMYNGAVYDVLGRRIKG